MRYKLIAVVSQDGFIARYSGDNPESWTSKEEKIFFKSDMQDCEWSAMGRKTHELSYNKNKKRIIFSRDLSNFRFVNNNHVYFNPNQTTFDEIIKKILPATTICILGGTTVYDYFMNNKLLDELIITIEPITFRRGLPLFSQIKWKNFIDHFIKDGFVLAKEIKKINKNGTKYFHLLKN